MKKTSLAETKKIRVADELIDAQKVLISTKESVSILFSIFEALKSQKGTSTDRQQDILRSALLMACAGFDSLLKQLVDDAIDKIRLKNKKSKAFFNRETALYIKHKDSDKINAEVIANALISGNPETYFVGKIKEKISNHSLQSYRELVNILDAFGIDNQFFSSKKEDIHAMFSARNSIAHNFDYDFSVKARGVKHRTQRGRVEVKKYTDLCIEIMDSIFSLVNETLV